MAFTGDTINIEFTVKDDTGNTAVYYKMVKELEEIDIRDQLMLIRDAGKTLLANNVVSISWSKTLYGQDYEGIFTSEEIE
jgi:hypothetical protein